MTVTPVGLNQQVYMGQQNCAVQPVQNDQVVAQNQIVPVEQTNTYPQYITYNPTNYPNNNLNNLKNLFPETNSYKYDILMQGLDFNKLAEEMSKGHVAVQESSVVTQQTQQRVPQQTVAFTGGAVNDGLTNCLVSDEDNKKYGPLKLGPTIGTAVGVATPFVCNKMRLGKFLTKDLLVKVPVISAGGLCVGSIVEGAVASAKKLKDNKIDEALASPVNMDVKA